MFGFRSEVQDLNDHLIRASWIWFSTARNADLVKLTPSSVKGLLAQRMLSDTRMVLLALETFCCSRVSEFGNRREVVRVKEVWSKTIGSTM